MTIMLKAVFEPAQIDIFHKFNPAATTATPAGSVVMKDTTDAEVVLVSDGTSVWGLLSQEVTVHPGPKFNFPFNNFEAFVGDQVGIYTQAGYFHTDQYVIGTYVPGASLYVTSEGKLTATLDTQATPAPTTTTGIVKVGEVVKEEVGDLFFLYRG